MAKKDETPEPIWGYEKGTGIPLLFEDGKLPKDFFDSPAKCAPFAEDYDGKQVWLDGNAF